MLLLMKDWAANASVCNINKSDKVGAGYAAEMTAYLDILGLRPMPDEELPLWLNEACEDDWYGFQNMSLNAGPSEFSFHDAL